MNASSSKSEGYRHMIEEELEGDGDVGEEGDFTPLHNPVFSASSDSLGACSQHTSYSQFGENDICDAILAYDPTQPNAEENLPPPDSATSSETSLGKRKASELSVMSLNSYGPFRPPKIPRPVSLPAGEDSPFLNNPAKEGADAEDEPDNIYAPICYSPLHLIQRMFDTRKIPYGVQYEIARYISLGKFEYSQIYLPELFKLSELQTNREAVPATTKIILQPLADEDDDLPGEWKNAFARERAAKSPWIELDREEDALSNNPYGGLGFNEAGEYLNWYGGQVLFHGKLGDISAKNEKRPRYKITLEPAELGPSNMYARRFGSKHFFRLKLTKAVMNKNFDLLGNYLSRPLILCGGVFRAFLAKESNVFYVRTNEKTDGASIIPGETIKGVMSFLEFLEWHNPMDFNNNQTMAKYVSRFALGLSNSVPGAMIAQTNIRFIDDIISASGSNMTDGAGKINRWSLNQLRHRLDWEERPTAIQMRIFGTKGLLVDDGQNAEEVAYVEVTPSQRKIQFPLDQPIDLAHRIIDVLRCSHTKSPCRLSPETIVCLADNGVKKQVFIDLLQKSLKELVDPLLEWEVPDAMLMLWANVRRLGGVMAARRAREEAGLARVKGYSEREADEELEDEDGFNVDVPEQRSTAYWADDISGSPSSLEETIMYMLDSGFKPQECLILRDKLSKFIKGRVNNYVKAYKIEVPMSASAFLVPDTLGILKPGEVFFRSSRRQFLQRDGTESDIFIGDVLVTRNPCKLPTDIQKWKSVDRPELHHLTDVIVLPTTGDRRAADFLSGGDQDGDKGTFITDPKIVDQFTNAPLHFSEPPRDINSHFARENVQVSTFQQSTASSVDYRIRQFQKHLLAAVCTPSVVGKYSNFHDIAIYTLGYRDKETIRLAYMFCMALDGVKTGMTVSSSTLKEDAKKFQKRSPDWKEAIEEQRLDGSNEANLKRPPKLGRFIMDEIQKHADLEADKTLARVQGHFSSQEGNKVDQDLIAPWNKSQEIANRWNDEEGTSRMMMELRKIQDHVEYIYNQHRAEMSSPQKQSRTSPKKGKGASFTDLPIEVRQDKIRELSKQFASFPSPKDNFLMSEEEIARTRASYAYFYDHDQRRRYEIKFSRFPWDVAMRELCAIKTRALGRFKTVDGGFYEHFNIKHPKHHHF
ncbi:hypothetical protein GALMADRAFT_150744 [Galerina marginata CBS 339.88]|uniref:RNA-dependent RNA polymerase n=1 Tax=Galerina marginata (strain CBS 339.88) TaxID=685588 RepID=A0A067TKH5_GALM3|nr:hypothetical protein GALMADRAFT_150744 [Galerina marginata CBS 339.88]